MPRNGPRALISVSTDPRIQDEMTADARDLLAKALNLPDRERLELATELIASVDGPPDNDWDALWLAELDRRVQRAHETGQRGDDWTTVRARILARLTRS